MNKGQVMQSKIKYDLMSVRMPPRRYSWKAKECEDINNCKLKQRSDLPFTKAYSLLFMSPAFTPSCTRRQRLFMFHSLVCQKFKNWPTVSKVEILYCPQGRLEINCAGINICDFNFLPLFTYDRDISQLYE